MIILLLVFAALVALGIVFLRGKGTFLISGCNSFSKSEKENIDEKKLCRFMAKFMFALSACWLVMITGFAVGIKPIAWWGMLLFLAVAIAGVILANTGGCFKK